jgi:hypothetical protein
VKALAFVLVLGASYDIASVHAQSESTQPTLPALLNTALSNTPSAGRTIKVSNLQRAMDTTRAGDRLVMACNSTWTGNLVIKPSTGGIAGQWRTVTTDCPAIAEGTRAAPTGSFAKIVSANVLPAITTNGPASKVRFIGVEVTTTAATNQGLIALGCSNDCEKSLAEQPSDIIIDRSYVHGTAAVDVRRCVALNGARLAIIDSYVSECHSTFDAQAVGGWNGPGPLKISNNYLVGAAENIAFGGADPAISGLVPSDIEITRNYIVKPLAWKGSKWLTKNLIELKQGRRVLVAGNVLENSWIGAQNGLALVMWSVNQQGTCKWCVVEHVTIQDNIVKNAAGFASLNVMGGDGNPKLQAVPMNHIAIRNNVAIGLTGWRTFEIIDTIANLSIEHNTLFNPGNSSFLWNTHARLKNHVVRNNLTGGGQYQLFSTAGGTNPWQNVGGSGSVFTHNVVVGLTGPGVDGNWFPGSFGELKFIGSNPLDGNATLDSLTLAPSSGFRKKGTDGKDLGADIAGVKAATANVVTPR